jgi:glycosyltransferase involved in cell wall biosynthesis
MDLSIIIVTYNSATYLPGLLNSIRESKDKLNKETIVIDNASQDNSLLIAQRHPLHPIVINAKSNQGFSKSVNLALKKSKGDYIMLLNPDTRIVGNCFRTLYNFASTTNPLGAVVPKLIDLNNKPQS